MSKRIVALLLSTALLTGCVSAPSTTPSEVALKSETLGLSTAPAPVVADTWWTAFGDPQLNALVEQALAGNPNLAAALARLRAAQSQLSATRAGTYPQVSVDGQDMRERLSKNYIIPPPYGGSTQWVGTVQANLSWSLDLFGKEAAQVDQARATANAATLDATAARLALSGAVTQAYIALDRAYVLVDVGEEAVKQREGILTLTRGRVKAGLDTNSARSQAGALLALAREDLIAAQATRELAVHQIAALIGRGADVYGIARPKLNLAALALPDTLPADLLSRRADIAAALARIDAAAAGRTAAHQAFYPDINLVGLAGFAALGLTSLFSASSGQYGLGAAIHLPIFDAGKLRAQYAGATAKLDESVADYNSAVIGAVKQTADALTDLRATEDKAAQQRIALSSAEHGFSDATVRYRSGLAPQTNVLDIEDVLIQAKRQYATLTSDTASARVALLMAVGGGFDAKTDETTKWHPRDMGNE
jgi:NodT family efflux transporter outer membrane factor (OMF) lipoprotein